MDPIKLKRRGPVGRWFYSACKLMELQESSRYVGRELSLEEAFHSVMEEAEKELGSAKSSKLNVAFLMLCKELEE